MLIQERGRITQSTDAAGTTGSSSTLTLVKPQGATLRRAAIFAASTGFTGRMVGDIRLDGNPITFEEEIPNNIQSYNYWAEVTDQVRGKVEAAPAGNVDFMVQEDNSASVDGVILTLIFDDPAHTSDRTVAILFGATRTSGDEFVLRMSQPLDPARDHLELALGISFGYQTGGPDQYSTVDVNGRRLTSSAGGEDDGEPANGALITVGGTGDSPSNPDPYAPVTSPRTDDELYDLRPFVQAGDMVINVATANPSNDDNIFFAAFTTDPPATTIGTPSTLTGFAALHARLDALIAAGQITGYTADKIRHALNTAELWLGNPRQFGPALSHLDRAARLLLWQADVVDKGKPNQGDASALQEFAAAIRTFEAALRAAGPPTPIAP